MKFLLESLQDLDDQLKKILGSGIWLLKGNPSDIFRKLHKNFGIHKICFEQDCEPIWKNRDENVKRTCKELGISVEERISHTLWNPKDVIKANGGYAPLTYEMMLHTINVLGFPARPEKDADFSGVKFGELSENLQCELKVFKKVRIAFYED